jgi:hypothetical protein
VALVEGGKREGMRCGIVSTATGWPVVLMEVTGAQMAAAACV